jgi:DNA-binding winged helix-turn-helix (wHTH) protein
MLSTSHVLAFGDFRFDKSAHELSRLTENGASTPIPLGSRAGELLCLLLRRPGDLVTKNEIMDAVWPNTAVDDSNLPVQIAAVRRALDDGSGTSSIQTVPGRGYRFTLRVAKADETVDVAERVVAQSEEIRFEGSKSEGCKSAAREASASVSGPPSISARSSAAPVTAALAAPITDDARTVGSERGAGWRLLGAGVVTGFLVAAAVLAAWRGYPASQFNLTAVAAADQPQAAEPPSQRDLTGIWQGNDGGSYSIIQSGNQVTWEGVSGDSGQKWTHTFRGAIHDNQVVGRYFDHPPGRNHNAGGLTVEIVDKDRFEKVSTIGTFVGSVWTRQPSAPLAP